MITQDDIEAFAEANEPALKAAHEYSRRAEKGIPEDRWSDGRTGALLVARGIRAQAAMIASLSGAVLDLLAEKQDAGRLFTKDSKYAQKED